MASQQEPMFSDANGRQRTIPLSVLDVKLPGGVSEFLSRPDARCILDAIVRMLGIGLDIIDAEKHGLKGNARSWLILSEFQRQYPSKKKLRAFQMARVGLDAAIEAAENSKRPRNKSRTHDACYDWLQEEHTATGFQKATGLVIATVEKYLKGRRPVLRRKTRQRIYSKEVALDVLKQWLLPISEAKRVGIAENIWSNCVYNAEGRDVRGLRKLLQTMGAACPTPTAQMDRSAVFRL